MTYRSIRSLTLVTLVGILAACAPPPTGMPQSGNLTVDMRRLQATVKSQQQTIENLSSQIADLQALQQDQARDIQELRQISPNQALGRSLSAGTRSSMPLSSRGTYTPEQGDSSPTEVYLQSFGDYASGRYQSAIRGFETFLQRFPNNSYASNAQYWLADCYFNQQQYPLAIQEFEQVLSDYTDAPKSPEALYKIAVAHLQLGAHAEARSTLAVLEQRYPKSTATQKARELVIP